MSIVIENDFNDTRSPDVLPKGDIDSLDPKKILDIIREAGIVGMGGAAFPTHVKLSIPPDKKVDTLIINGAECEPFLTADHRMMLEYPDEVLYGARAAMKVLGVKNVYIGIENNKKDAVESMQNAARDLPVDIRVLKVKYPQGAEKQLIDAITRRQVPVAGLPMDVGVVVMNVSTAYAVSQAIKAGMPLIERVTTVTGQVKNPSNLLVRVGTSFKDALEYCGGVTGDIAQLIAGGPMMGHRPA